MTWEESMEFLQELSNEYKKREKQRGIKIYTNEKGMEELKPKNSESKLIEAIQQDMEKSGINISVEDIEAQVKGATAEKPQVEATEDEKKIMLEYQKVFIECGGNHRKAKRIMDKKYGFKRRVVFGSYKQKI